MAAVRISVSALDAVLERALAAAAGAGLAHIRHPGAFKEHLLDVAVRAEAIALRLAGRMPRRDAPDPTAAFVAGAWHDAAKIHSGDDFHEIGSALEVLDLGAGLGLVHGDADDVEETLRRAAAAILPGFALYEQWQPSYRPSSTSRGYFEAGYCRLVARLGPPRRPAGHLLLPWSVDALVHMYADMTGLGAAGAAGESFEHCFQARWAEIDRRSAAVDPGLREVLPVARPRVRRGCELINRFLLDGFDEVALADFRKQLPA